MKKILARDHKPQEIQAFLNRGQEEDAAISGMVRSIIQDVKDRGDEALADYSLKFDGLVPDEIKVSQEEIDEAYKQVDPELIEVLKEARDNIWAYNERIREEGFFDEVRPGVCLGQRLTPIEKVGIYVPGGKASYPSTVLMTATPARVAGCEEIIMVSPPNRDGGLDPVILLAADLAGVTAIYKCGGAQAIAGLAYGTQTIPRVYKIVGPGNIYVARAKSQVFGQVDIDMIAGPSEICVIADETAELSWIAADLLSQAEHDERAAPVLITTSQRVFEGIDQALEDHIKTLGREDIIRQSLASYGLVVLVKDLDEALVWANAMAPEHLELVVRDPEALVTGVRNAGAIFLGPYTPEPVGDYIAGPNHTLPTGGTARFSSPLGVYDFLKRTSVISYSKEAFEEVRDSVALFAGHEGLRAHGLSMEVRRDD